MPNQEGLYKSNAERTRTAREKALEAILALKSERKPVNFSTIAKQSGVSRHFLYSDEEVKKAIEEERGCDVENEINRRARFDKTAKSKDIIIEAKEKRIAKLEEENKRLKAELSVLRGMVYATSNAGSTSGICIPREECSNSGG